MSKFEYKAPSSPEEKLRESLARFSGQMGGQSKLTWIEASPGQLAVVFLCNTLIRYLDETIGDDRYGANLVEELENMKPGDKYPWFKVNSKEL